MSLSFLNNFYFVDFLFSFIKLFVAVVWFYCCFLFSFLTGLSSLLEPSAFRHLALPVGACSLGCNNNNNLPKRALPIFDNPCMSASNDREYRYINEQFCFHINKYKHIFRYLINHTYQAL